MTVLNLAVATQERKLSFTAINFNAVYEAVSKEIPFNPDWNNGTGYFDGSVEGPCAVVLESGEMAKSITPLPNNRKVLFVGTPLGTFAVFQRYTDGDSDVFVYNATRQFDSLIKFSRPLSESDMSLIIGQSYENGTNNVGTWLNKLAGALANK